MVAATVQVGYSRGMRTIRALAAFLSLLPCAALAHGGGLNADGCHTDRKTGNYHCHGGGSGGGSSSPRPTYSTPPPYSAPSARPAPAPRAAPATQAAISGSVELISVGDGDTIRVRGANGKPVTIRLACIDAPESAQSSGPQATATLRQLLGAGRLEIRPQTVDRYGRTVAEVYAGGQNVNVAMVANGAAFVYHQYLQGCDASAYQVAEDSAMRRRLGVWRWDRGEQRPWDFRRQR
jgi:endonuclease YncB( thermonuclease family)